MHIKLGLVCIGKRIFKCRYIPFNMSNQSMHWSKKYQWSNAWKEEVMQAVRLKRNGEKLPFKTARVQIIFHTIKLMDYDGAYNAAKPILDGLKQDYAGVIIDDSPKYIDLEVKQNKVKHLKDQFVEIFII